jgi:hypothetical protein
MMADPFTIRIFVPDGDPEGVRLIDRMNWTGLGLVFPRAKWLEVRQRPELQRTGIYILVGYSNQDDDLPTLYIGQADGVRGRIESHYTGKDFWDWGAVFVSNSGGVNRAHVTWLEYALVKRATEAKRCHLDNGNSPQEPALSEAEKADTRAFLKEILQILPLVGLRAFEIPKAVAIPQAVDPAVVPQPKSAKADTIIVPAQKEGFEKVFDALDEIIRLIRASEGKADVAGLARLEAQVGHDAVAQLVERYAQTLGRLAEGLGCRGAGCRGPARSRGPGWHRGS